jgi:hypothetical protein
LLQVILLEKEAAQRVDLVEEDSWACEVFAAKASCLSTPLCRNQIKS